MGLNGDVLYYGIVGLTRNADSSFEDKINTIYKIQCKVPRTQEGHYFGSFTDLQFFFLGYEQSNQRSPENKQTHQECKSTTYLLPLHIPDYQTSLNA